MPENRVVLLKSTVAVELYSIILLFFIEFEELIELLCWDVLQQVGYSQTGTILSANQGPGWPYSSGRGQSFHLYSRYLPCPLSEGSGDIPRFGYFFQIYKSYRKVQTIN